MIGETFIVEKWRQGKAKDSYPEASKDIDIAAARVCRRSYDIIVNITVS